MRKVVFGGASSLDNFIARPDGAVDWLRWSKDAGEISSEFWKTVDTILMGRKTYEVALGYAKSGAAPPAATPGVTTHVFSRTLDPADHPDVRVVAENAARYVDALKRSEGKDVCVMGGGDFARTLFDAGLIDEIGLNVHPVLLGAGVPLFHATGRQIDLELVECRRLEHDCVYVRYRVAR